MLYIIKYFISFFIILFFIIYISCDTSINLHNNINYIKILLITIATKKAVKPLDILVPSFNLRTSIPKKQANVIYIKYKQPAIDMNMQ